MLQPLVRNWKRQWRLRKKIVFFSKISCPRCHARSLDQMPSNASVYFYHCLQCNTIFNPKPGDCCVYCSYGTMRCPPRQKGW